jgi:hypothetical protein
MRWVEPGSRLRGPLGAILAILVLGVVVLNALLIANQLSIILAGYPGADLVDYQQAADRFWTGGLYDTGGAYNFRYSPVAAFVFGALRGLDPLVWRMLHVAAALALPTWPMRILLIASWPFAFDLQLGNIMTFMLLAAAWALRGNRAAGLVFLAMALLAPRPLIVPIAAWLLWRQPGLRWPFVGMFAVHAVLVVLSGWGDEWLARLLTSTDEVGSAFNVGPTALIGLWWLVLGIPLGVWLFRRGKVGLAGLAISPYVLPYYLMTALLDLPGRQPEAGTR